MAAAYRKSGPTLIPAPDRVDSYTSQTTGQTTRQTRETHPMPQTSPSRALERRPQRSPQTPWKNAPQPPMPLSERLMDHCREPFYMGLLTLAIALLWTIAWSRGVGDHNDGYLPAAQPMPAFLFEDTADADTANAPVPVRSFSGPLASGPVAVANMGR